jgi:hypothetical protein
MPARKPPKNGRPWTPEKVRERIRIGMIVHRLEQQALGKMRGHQIYKVPLIREGQIVKGEDGKPLKETRIRSKAMTPIEYHAAVALLSTLIPKAEAPKDINLRGNITVIRRDPTQRPEGYKRRGKASQAHEH